MTWRFQPVGENASTVRSADAKQPVALSNRGCGEPFREVRRTKVVETHTQVHRKVLGGFPVILEECIPLVDRRGAVLPMVGFGSYALPDAIVDIRRLINPVNLSRSSHCAG